MKTVCLYHSCDLDGQCSGAIVNHFVPGVILYGINYGEPPPWDLLTDSIVYLVDFSLQPFDQMIKLQKVCRKLIWIDHHKGVIEEAQRHSFMRVEGRRVIGRAACELCWEYFTGALHCIQPVYLLGRFDVWDHSHPDTLPFQYGIQRQNTNPTSLLWKKLFSEDQELIETIINDGKIIQDYIEKDNEKYAAARCFSTEIDGHPAIACNKGLTNSKLFDSVWDPERYDLMIAFSRSANKYWSVSMYTTRDDVDVSLIAQKYGGNGHIQAAGCQCKELPFEI